MNHNTTREFRCEDKLPTGSTSEPHGPRQSHQRSLCSRERFRRDPSRAGHSRKRVAGGDRLSFLPAPFIEKPQATLQFNEERVGRRKNIERNCEFACERVAVILSEMKGLTAIAVGQFHC